MTRIKQLILKISLELNHKKKLKKKNNCVSPYRTLLYHKTVWTYRRKCELCCRSSRICESGKQYKSVKTKI